MNIKTFFFLKKVIFFVSKFFITSKLAMFYCKENDKLRQLGVLVLIISNKKITCAN